MSSDILNFHINNNYVVLISRVDDTLLVQFPSQVVYKGSKTGIARLYQFMDNELQCNQFSDTIESKNNIECPIHLYRPLVLLDMALLVTKLQISHKLIVRDDGTNDSALTLLPRSDNVEREEILIQFIKMLFDKEEVVDYIQQNDILDDAKIIFNVIEKGGII